MSLILTDEQKVTLSVQPLTAAGHPAPVDGPPAWASSDPTVVALDVAADGLSAVATSGALGHAQVTVSADADLGAGVRPIAGTLEVDVVAAEAVSLGVSAGEPTVK